MTSSPGGRELFLLPFERTTSYMTGTGRGPSVLQPLLIPQPFDYAVYMDPGKAGADEYLGSVAEKVQKAISAGLKIAGVGGEHTVTYGIFLGLTRAGMRPAVIQLDAHADLRGEYEGTPWSHACVMRRIIEDFDLPVLAVGIRSLSREESLYAVEKDISILYAHQMKKGAFSFSGLMDHLGRDVYLTFDADFLDPSVMPGTGTPEPGGALWYEAFTVIDKLLEGRNLVGFDFVEYSPEAECERSAAAAAGLIRHLCGYL